MIGMKRWLVVFFLLSLFVSASRFAALEVKPNKNSDLDLNTGIYTLDSGGTITDNKSKISLNAKYIQYKEGDFIKAKEATFKTKEGDFAATTLEYQYGPDVLKLGGMRFSSANFKGISAQTGTLYKEDVLLLKGEVRSSDPLLETQTLVVDTAKNQALVLGNFNYKQGSLSLKGQKADSTLLLNFTGDKVQANTKVPAEVLARLKPYADK